VEDSDGYDIRNLPSVDDGGSTMFYPSFLLRARFGVPDRYLPFLVGRKQGKAVLRCQEFLDHADTVPHEGIGN
jgi:hypothetical protein